VHPINLGVNGKVLVESDPIEGRQRWETYDGLQNHCPVALCSLRARETGNCEWRGEQECCATVQVPLGGLVDRKSNDRPVR
jgi:hypothetical protein